MADRTGTFIEAAGGVLWRNAAEEAGTEVALVHRPKYDDWSVPKGKLTLDEHPLLGAVREVTEETGHQGRVGRPLGEVRYLKHDAPKRVRYWAMSCVDGEFAPTDEVDRLMWLPPLEAQAHATRDRLLLRRFAADLRPTRACIVLRHASAGSRTDWSGDDRARPLDDLGRDQVALLSDLLQAYGIERVFSADVLRCLDTVRPYAARRGIPVEPEPLLSELGYPTGPEAAADRLMEVICLPQPAVVCTQRKVLPGLMGDVSRRLGLSRVTGWSLAKGAFVVLHLTAGDGPEPVAIERFTT